MAAGGGAGRPGFPGQQVDEYFTSAPGGYDGAEFPGHVGPFGLHDWTDRGERYNGAFAAVPFRVSLASVPSTKLKSVRVT